MGTPSDKLAILCQLAIRQSITADRRVLLSRPDYVHAVAGVDTTLCLCLRDVGNVPHIPHLNTCVSVGTNV
jgi:hypothetical protein